MKLVFPKHLKLDDDCGAGLHVPANLLLQWHITERCNLRCQHCYQDTYSGDEMSFQQQLDVIAEFKNLLADWRKQPDKQRLRGHITVSGGDPFVRDDFTKLLQEFANDRKWYSFGILTNGTFIDENMARNLKQLRPAFVQVSIEGTKETHDAIRGEGNHDITCNAIRHLVKQGVRTLISFTAHRANYKEFPEVARLGRKLKVDKVWADRFIPNGAGMTHMSGEAMTEEETRDFCEIMKGAQRKAKRAWFNRTEITMNRALQFLEGHGEPYNCKAGDSLITLMPNGDLYPCRRMPIPVGNLLQTPLATLYEEAGLFNELRDRKKVSAGCEGCFYTSTCRGGLKCLSYAVTGDPFVRDPGCWRDISEDATATPQNNFMENES